MHGSLLGIGLDGSGRGGGTITDIGASLPRIADRALEVAGHQREVEGATLTKRAGLTLQFNRLLGASSRTLGFHLIDLTHRAPAPSERPAMHGLSERLVVDRLVGDGKSVKRV